MLIEFKQFLGFLELENIKLPWKSINGHKMKHKGGDIGAIMLGAGGWLDDAIDTKNYVLFHIYTGDFDGYLSGLPDVISDMLLEQISHKCTHCRPTCGCSKMTGRTVQIAGRRYENVCNNAPVYKLYASGDGMQTLTLCTPARFTRWKMFARLGWTR
ncbi:MAG: hypothetical protein FWE68_06780 [Defluviitaleaceae bacterium]|nr:hypothetical protein [Defluviitaleaceae bacterium]